MGTKGTKTNPYSYNEYLALCSQKKWNGGYVTIEDGRIEYIDAQDTSVDHGGSGSGSGESSGSGSGEGSGSGSGEGTNDKPLYMVYKGTGEITAYDDPAGKITITLSWSDGIAAPTPGGGCSNKDGFISNISSSISFQRNVTLTEYLPCPIWSAPYTISMSASITYKIGKKTYSTRIDQAEYIIPDTFYENF